MRKKRRTAPTRDKRVVIQRIKSNATATAHNEVNRSTDANWEDVATRWCGIKHKTTTEGAAGDGIIAASTAEFDLRYDAVTAAISPENRLKHGTLIYQIGPVINVDERNDTILVTGVRTQ